jgi:hypothetical protein
MSNQPRILYCHCAYAKVVPDDVKNDVLRRLAESGIAFDAVADLCELSAKRDPALQQLVVGVGENGTQLRLAACYPRALKWLFNAAGVAWPESGLDVGNMRTDSSDQVIDLLLNGKSVKRDSETVEPEPSAA